MKYFLLIIIVFFSGLIYGQDTLPNISVVNAGDKIIVSWKNNYKKPVANISIQRSYDSLKHYSTIGTVLNPQNLENGYSDNHPPYNRMYYRVFISFEGGSYIITQPKRPVKLPRVTEDSVATPTLKRFPWQADPLKDSITATLPGIKFPPPKKEITYPSERIYTSKDQFVIINLPDAVIRNYSAKFFDSNGKEVFILTRLNEQYYILEKVNFQRSGWYTFELYEGGRLVEKNKLFIPKDGKINNGDVMKKAGNK